MAGVYVHIPFCNAKCSYCDFYSLANHTMLAGYVDALGREWHARRHELSGEPIRTVYIGGGTPSVLPPDDIARITALFPHDHLAELTIEVNPEGVYEAACAAWKAAGVNRVSIGVQSLVDDELRRVGRRHSAEAALRAIETIQTAGISNISADLIYGLPGQTLASWEYSVGLLLASGITHLSAYSLTFEPGTRLYMQRERGLVEEADEALSADMYDMLCEKAREADFSHYEISNFGRPGYHSRHNSSYWKLTPYLGLGPGAHSLGADGLRRFNASDLKKYMAAPESFTEVDYESDDDRFNDIILIGLRTAKGVDISQVDTKYLKHLLEKTERLAERGALVVDGSKIYIPEERWLTSDAVIRELFV